ncbi:transposase [Methylobacterium sp. A54F]
MAPSATVIAYEARHWDALHAVFPSVGRINHSATYATEDANTKQAESYFSRLRRMVSRQHHFVSAHHLHQYATEAAWKEDHRRMPNDEQFQRTLRLALAAAKSWQFCGYWQRHTFKKGS